MAIKIDLKDVLDDINIGGIFKGLGKSNIFTGLDLGDIFKTVSGVNLPDLSIGGLFNAIPDISLFDDFKVDPKLDLTRAFDGIADLGDLLKDISIPQFFDDVTDLDVMKGIKLDKLFGGLDDALFSPLFGNLSLTGLVEDVSGLDLTRSSGGGSFDLLDGVGVALNLLGGGGVLDVIDVVNILRGSTGRNVLKGLGADDLITALDGVDRLLGGNGDDILNAGSGDDRLDGGKGDDVLFGGLGRDRMKGGRGEDTFVMALQSGFDMIDDFKNGFDKLALMDGLDFKDLKIEQKGKNTVISMGGDQLAVLRGVKKDLINAADFVAGQVTGL